MIAVECLLEIQLLWLVGSAPKVLNSMQASLAVLRQDDKSSIACQTKLDQIADNCTQLQQNLKLAMVRYGWARDAATLEPALGRVESLLNDGVFLEREAGLLVAVVHEAKVLMGCAEPFPDNKSMESETAAQNCGSQGEEDPAPPMLRPIATARVIGANTATEDMKDGLPSVEDVERMVLNAGIPAAYLDKLVAARTKQTQVELTKARAELDEKIEEYEMLEEMFNPVLFKERELTTERSELTALALIVQNGNNDLPADDREQRNRLGLEDGVVVDTIKVKTMGELDSKWLNDRNVPVEDISFYQDCLIGDKGACCSWLTGSLTL